MALPYRTFSQSIALMELVTALKLSSTNLAMLYNLSYREILTSHTWYGRFKESVINTVNDYSDGTVTVVVGADQVSGVGTLWLPDMRGRFIRVDDSDLYYQITDVIDFQTLVIEKAWPFMSAGAQPYTIFGLTYALPADAETILHSPTSQWTTEERSYAWVSARDPARRATGNTIQVWVPRGVDAAGNLLVEFWPRFAAATSVRVPYSIRVQDLSGTEQPLVRSDVIENHALEYAFTRMYSEFGDKHYIELAQKYRELYASSLETALRDDYERQALPRSVQPQYPFVLGYDFLVSHDV